VGERVLIVRFSGIGDIVMALPVAHTVKASQSNSSVAWFVDTRFRDLVRGHSQIDEVFEFDRARFRGKAWLPSAWGSQLRAYFAPRKWKPTVAIDLQGHTKTSLVARFSGARRRFVQDPKDPLSRLSGRAVRSPQRRHMVERNLDVAAAAGFAERTIRFDVPTESVEVASADYATVHLGGTHARKIWPVERFIAASKELREVVVVGAASEKGLAEQFASAVPSENLVGKTSLAQLSHVLANSRLHLSGDTGTAHIAASFGVPCVTVFGHMPPEVFHPWGQRDAVVESGGDILSVTADAAIERIAERKAEAAR
jgi:heptosyltransferase-1